MREHVDTQRLTDLVRALVAVDTSNPPGNEAAARDVLMEALAPWGPSWEEVEPAPGRLSLIARLPRAPLHNTQLASTQLASTQLPSTQLPDAPHRPTLIINGHTDVVPVVASRWAAARSTPRSWRAGFTVAVALT